MPDLYLVVDLMVVLALTVLSLSVLLTKRSAEINKIFVLFVVCISIWIISNYISNDTKLNTATAVIADYCVFFFSYNAAIYLLRFVISLAGDIKARYIFHKVNLILLTISISGLTPLVVKGVVKQDKVYAVQFGPLVSLYFSTLILIILFSLLVTYRNIKTAKGNQKLHLKILFKSLCLAFPIMILAQVILPVTVGWFGFTNFGVLPMLILVYGLYYGVIKHRLFDLRLIIVRSLAYLLSLGIIVGLYGAISRRITNAVASLSKTAFLSNSLTSLFIAGLIISYPPLKKYFDQITNRIFYRDAYDPQQFMDELNRTLVTNTETDKLLTNTTEIIGRNIKADFTVFSIRETAYFPRRIIGNEHKRFTDKDIEKVGALTSHIRSKIIIADRLDDREIKLKKLLEENDIAIIVRLVTTLNYKVAGIGYMILGPKKSGNPYGTQDLKLLGIVANELVIAIQNALRFEEIENFNITLQQKVNDATLKLRRGNEKLKALDESKDEFISMASHQLRTPLTSVKGYVSMVLDGDAGKITGQQRQLLEQAFSSSQRMVYLIADLLNVSRLKTGKFVIESKPTNLADVVESEIGQLSETAQIRQLELTYKKPSQFPELMLDETKIRQVIMNFIDNAIYYTPPGGHISVALNDKPDSIELLVTDDGIGVPKSEQHHLFTKFYRAGNARQARPDGTGLGLFMAQKVIVAQGGAIIFNSREGHGSTFGFSFAKHRLTAA